MDSLVNSWDEPVAENSPKGPTVEQDDEDINDDAPRPSKRSRQSLFFSDSEDDDVDSAASPSRRATHKAPPIQNVDIDALFADLDDDDALRPLPARIDEEEMTRHAEARQRRNMPALTPHQILPSSSPQRDTGSPSGSKRKGAQDKGDEEKKARRQVVKLDEARIMSPNYGFPQLIKMTKDFKLKGKGHEATDLNRLLQKYQYWTHQLYPKLQFQDTVERVEKLCHSRRMNVALSVWRDEFHGRTGQRQGIEDNDDDNGAIDDDDQVEDTRMDTDDTSSRLPRSSPSLPSSRGSSPPLTSGAENDVDHEPASRDPSSAGNGGEDDDDQAFWRSLDEFGGASMNANAPPPLPIPTSAPAPVRVAMGDDEDMWDIIDEVEKESSMKATPASTAAPISSTILTGAMPSGEVSILDPADVWDDMYL